MEDPNSTAKQPTRRRAHDSLINVSRLRRYTFEVAGQRHHRFTRVSEEFVQKAAAHLRTWVRDYVRQLPSKGKTIR